MKGNPPVDQERNKAIRRVLGLELKIFRYAKEFVFDWSVAKVVIWASFKNYIWIFGGASFVFYWGLPELSKIELLILYFSVGAFVFLIYIFLSYVRYFLLCKKLRYKRRISK